MGEFVARAGAVEGAEEDEVLPGRLLVALVAGLGLVVLGRGRTRNG